MNMQKATQVHLIAWRTSFVWLVATLAVVIMPAISAQIPVVPKHGLWLAATLLSIAVLGLGMSRRNRACAVALFVSCVADQIVWWTSFRNPSAGLFQPLLMSVSLVVVFLLGMPATFALHQKVETENGLRLAQD